MRSPNVKLPLGLLSLALVASANPFSDQTLFVDDSNNTAPTPDFTQPPISNISLYANGSLFYQWRPKAHFIHPSNQLGDPTAFWQDSNGTSHITALYSFLRGTGNSSLSTSAFSGSTTKDFLQYEDLSGWENAVQMGPGNEVDYLADFDGGVVAEGYKGLPTLIWTAVKGLPISWTIPYKDGYESQALAYSEDNGVTWKKLDGGANVPVIPRPPYNGSVVTGFRDPFIFKNARLDSLLNINASSNGQTMHYVSMSSGLHPAQPGLPGVDFNAAGPRVWLYRQNTPGDWLNWTFCGPLLQSTINTTFTTPGSGWAATDYSDGNNYETSQVTNLDFSGDSGSEGTGLAFMSFGAESNKTLMLYRLGQWKANEGINTSPMPNATLAPGVVGSDAGVELDTALEGLLDWGLAYACTGLRNEKDKRRIVYCWIKEAFASQDQTKFVTQWISSLTLSRQLYVKKIEGVVNNELVLQNASWAILNLTSSSGDKIETIPVEEFKASAASKNSTVDLVMLGISPATELAEFRNKANDSSSLTSPVTLSPANFSGAQVEVRKGIRSGTSDSLVDEIFVPLPRHPSSKHYELSATLSFPASSLRNTSFDFAAGLSILRRPNTTSADENEDIAIVYRPANESIIVQRRTALGPESVLTTPEVGKLRLWQFGNGTAESLNMRVFVDGSAVEIYINDVFVLTTRAYYWYSDSNRVGLVYQVPQGAEEGEKAGMQVEFKNVSWWEGLIDAYPNRPKDKEQLIKQAIGYPEPSNNPDAEGIIYNGTGVSPPFPTLS